MTGKNLLIGLEYEGVILKDGKIIRFSSMPKEHQEAILRRYPCPHDNYDCLAECRTKPFIFGSTRDIAYRLFSEVSMLTSIYNSVGYDIHWGEMEIPAEIHNAIKADVKFKKPILTIGKSGIVDIKNMPEEGFYRGGGIHINISGRSKAHLLGMALMAYNISSTLMFKFKSFYRKSFLFRFKPEFNGVELMSIGFDASQFLGIRQSFETTKHFFHLFDPIVSVLNENK